jgi:hypothetical protein
VLVIVVLECRSASWTVVLVGTVMLAGAVPIAQQSAGGFVGLPSRGSSSTESESKRLALRKLATTLDAERDIKSIATVENGLSDEDAGSGLPRLSWCRD